MARNHDYSERFVTFSDVRWSIKIISFRRQLSLKSILLIQSNCTFSSHHSTAMFNYLAGDYHSKSYRYRYKLFSLIAIMGLRVSRSHGRVFLHCTTTTHHVMISRCMVTSHSRPTRSAISHSGTCFSVSAGLLIRFHLFQSHIILPRPPAPVYNFILLQV